MPTFRSSWTATCFSALTCAAASLLAVQSAHAVTDTFTGAGANGLFSNAANFGGTTVVTGVTLAFNTTGTAGSALTNDNSGFTYAGLNFNAADTTSYTIGGNSFTLTSAINNNTTAATTQTINTAIVLGGSEAFVNSVTTDALTFGGVISGSATTYGVNFNGLGTTTLNGSAVNTYTGTTQVAGGSLVLDFTNLASATNLINSGSTLQLGTGTTGAGGNLTIKGAATGATSQTFAATNLNNYGNNVTLTANGGSGVTLTLGAINYQTGNTTVNFDTSSSAANVINSTTAAGTLGYATFKDSTGAVGFASATGTQLVRLTGQTALPASGTTTSTVDYVTSGTVTRASNAAFSVDTLTLDSTAATGALDLGGATMTLTKGGILFTGTNAYTLSDGQVGAAGSQVIVHTMGSGGVTISGTIGSGASNLIKNGPDTLTLSGTNTYTGTTTVNGGTLQAGSSSAFGSASAITISNAVGAVLNITGFDTTIGSLNGAGGSSVVIGTNMLTVGSNNTSTTYGGNITGTSGKLVKIGTGTQTLNGLSTFTGGVSILNGTLNVSNTNLGVTQIFPSNSTVLLGDTSGANNATFELSDNGNGTTSNLYNITAVSGTTGTLTIQGNSNIAINNAVTLGSGGGSQNLTLQGGGGGVFAANSAFTGTGNLNLYNTGSGVAVRVQLGTSANTTNNVGTLTTDTRSNAGSYIYLMGPVGANVTAFNSNSPGNVILLNATGSPAFIGNTNLTAGTFIVGYQNSLQNSVLNYTGGAVVFGNNTGTGTATTPTAISFGGLAGTANLALANSATTPAAVALTVGNSNASNGSATNPNTLSPVYSGILSGAGSIVKAGSNTQTFSGANTYTGGTAVNAGGLLLTNTTGSGTGTAAVTVTGTGTLLGGTGSASGNVTVNTGAILLGGVPGSASGALTLTGTTSLTSGSIIELTLGASNAHSSLALTGATLLNAQKFTLLSSQPGTYTNIITGVTTSTPSTFTATNTDYTYTFSPDATAGGIDLTVAAVPEPSTWMAGLLCVGALGLSQRRRVQTWLSTARRAA